MSAITYVFTVRDTSGTNAGVRKTGLTPTFVFLKKLSDGSDVTQPSITEIAQGQYKFSYDVETSGEASCQIDAGSGLSSPSDRYIDLILANSAVKFDQAVPTSNTSQTVGDSLNAARAQGFGKWVKSGTSLVLYAPDGTTPVRTFTLDQDTFPTSRS